LRNFENVIPQSSLRVFCICKALDLQMQNLSRTTEKYRFYSSRYNFIFQKLAFLKYKITRSDESGILTS